MPHRHVVNQSLLKVENSVSKNKQTNKVTNKQTIVKMLRMSNQILRKAFPENLDRKSNL